MGIASSSNSGANSGEGEHFVQIVNPQRVRPSTPSSSATKSGGENAKEKDKRLGIDLRARILRRIPYDYLWDAFLDQGFQSFALTPAEMQAVLEVAAMNSVTNPVTGGEDGGDPALSKSKVKTEQAAIDQEIKDFLALIGELDPSKTFDFMAVCSATLFFSEVQLETKVDQLYTWILLDPSEIPNGFCFEDFLVAISSFERGVSHAMARQNCSEAFIKVTAQAWWALADPQAKGPTNKISDKQFFEFCTNRQHVVRRLLEGLSALEVLENKNMELQEVNNEAIDNLISPPGGDEWMANPAWKKTAEKMVPPAVKEAYRNAKPQSNLDLEWVHGYRGYDCRNNIFYINPNQIIFTAAALCIVQVQRGNQKSQCYFSEHSDDILSIATAKRKEEPNVTLIATGEIGKSPAIYVYSWTCNDSSSGGSFQSLVCLRGCHTKGVAQLSFSADGKYLFSIGVEYTIAVYCTDKTNTKSFGKMIASSQGPKDRLMHSSFIEVDNVAKQYTFVTCGEKHAVVWKFDSNVGLLTQETVKLGPHKNKVLLCVVSCDSGALYSTSEGELLYAKGGAAAVAITVDKNSLTCHVKSAINALWSDGTIVVSGDKDGKLVGWKYQSNTLKAIWEFTISGYNESAPLEGLSGAMGKGEASEVASIKPPAIRAIALESSLQHMLVGTQRCELIQYALPQRLDQTLPKETFQSGLKSDILVSGHFQDEVWGLAVRPSTELNESSGIQYATVGDDGYLRIWDLYKHSLIKCVNLQGIARCCAYSPDGLYLAIGFGAGKNQASKGGKSAKPKEDGMVKVIRFDYDEKGVDFSLTQVAEIREAKQWISVVKFSPDGTTLAVGARDNSIYLYSVPNQFKRKVKFSKHNAGIAAFDFSACGKYIQSCCSGYEILFSEVQTGAQVTSGATKLMDTEWHTWTCTLGWSVIGIWSGSMDGSDINNVDRSPSGRYIATCDDFGKVNIFQYPALEEKGALCNSYSGHSSHVTCCRWISKPSSKKRAGKTKTDDFLISIGGEDKCVFQWRHTDSFSKRDEGGEDSKDAAVDTADVDVAVDEFDAPSGGDEFMAVKPWLGAIVAPTAWANPDPGKLPALYASLSEYANALNIVNQSDEVPSADAYEGLISTSEVVLRRMYDSGLVDPSPPSNDELELEWVHGYRGFDCRNNTFYIQMNQKTRYILFYAAALGILMDPKTKQQRYFKGHSDDIVSMAIHEHRNGESIEQVIVASGQQGISNVYVWEVPSMQTLAIVETKQKNLHLLSFSGDGRLVISIGQDLSIAVSDWKSSTQLATAKMENSTMFHMSVMTSPIPPSAKNDAGAAASSVQFLTCGDKVLRLWSVNGRNITSKKYTTTGGPKNVTAKLQHFLCATEIGGSFYVGCEDGSVYVIPFDGTAVKAVLTPPVTDAAGGKGKKASANSISAICKYVHGETSWLLCGAKDGSIIIWNVAGDKPSSLFSFQIGSVLDDIMAKQIQSLALTATSQANKFFMAVGTRGCDLLELEFTFNPNSPQSSEVKLCVENSKCAGIITRGHCNDELWGVATHPKIPQYCSVGDDKTLRFYDVHSHSMLLAVPLGHISRAVAYNHDGTMLGLGFGGRVGKGKETGGGIVRIYTVSQGSKMEVVKVAERQDAKQWISDLKFSNDSRVLVAGAHDCKIYIYNVGQKDGKVELQLKHTFGKHNSVINHVDLSNDGRYMQSNCSAYELLFCEVATGKQITAASELKDVKWQTWTCTLGWPVQGIWQTGMDGSDINAVSRSNSGHLLVTSDDFGKVNLFRYPVVDTTKSKSLSYSGHSSHVMNVRWTCGDECLISAGGNDKCLLQWRHRITDSTFLSSSGGSKADKKVRIAEDGAEEPAAHGEEPDAGGMDDLMHGPGGGDESGAVKPWVGAVRPPKSPPPISAQAPTLDIKLSWIHGYSCSAPSQRNNLFYNLGQKLIYPAASLAVLLDRSSGESNTPEWKQQYFKGHDDDVLCIAMSRDRRYIATGQIASKALKGKASVIVWDALQCGVLSRMESCHQRGVLSLAFNDTGSQLISVGMDDSFTHILWSDLGGSWSRVQQLSSAKGDKTPTLFASWVTAANAALWADCQFITGGVRSMSMWKIEGASLTKKQTKLGKKVQASTYLSMANLNSKDGWKVYFGTSNGDLLVLENRELQLCVEKAHDQAIQALVVNAEGNFMISGGKDGSIKMWNQSLQMTSYFELKDPAVITSLPLFDHSVVAVDICPSTSPGNKSVVLALGTSGGDLLEVVVPPLQSKSTKAPASDDQSGLTFDFSKAKISQLISSHTKGELWGLAVNPLTPDIYATVGDDKVLRLWSIKHNRCLQSVLLPRASRCLAWHPGGCILAVGLEEKKAAGGKGKGKGGGKGNAKKGKDAPKEGEEDEEGGTTSKGDDYSTVSVLVYAVKNPHLKVSSSKHEDTEDVADGFDVVLKATGCSVYKGSDVSAFPSVADIKFSLNEQYLCIAPKDCKMYCYQLPKITVDPNASNFPWDEFNNALQTKTPYYVLNKHTSMVTHFDFSVDCKYIQSNDLGNELLFYDLENKKQEPSATKLADYNGVLDDEAPEGRLWASQTCIFGWPVQGIWPPNAYDSSEINSVDRHNSMKYLATGEDSGHIRVLRFPSVTPNSSSVVLTGHSSHVTNVRWSAQHLISAGGNDKCVFVWEMTEK